MLEIFGVKGNSPCFVFFRGGFETDAAPTYLDTNFATANKHANPMSGYYTLDVINRDDQPMGMHSVNGYTRIVWPHTWHGKLLAMGAEEKSPRTRRILNIHKKQKCGL
jgi:hypothetical protein